MGVFDVHVQYVPAGVRYYRLKPDDHVTVIGLNVEHAIENARAIIREAWADHAEPGMRITITSVTLIRVLD